MIDQEHRYFYWQNIYWHACPKCGNGVDFNHELKKISCPEVDCEFEITFEDWKKMKTILKKPSEKDTPYSPRDMAERKKDFFTPKPPPKKKPRNKPDLFEQI